VDLYHLWFDLAPGVRDTEHCEAIDRYLGRLREVGEISSYRITRRKLGLGPAEIGEFHVIVEVENLAQLDRAFTDVSTRADPIETLHAAVNQHVRNVRFALYRDFPDPQRRRGGEKF
jgi:hypothetical protein